MVAYAAPAAESQLRPGELEQLLEAQRAAFRAHPMPSAAERRADLARLIDALRVNADAFSAAISADFGHRSRTETLTTEVLVCLEAARYARRHLRRWMRPSRRRVGLLMQSTRARVVYQPLGVVGIISPWNYPLQLSVVPLIYALAAGNRVMLKPSEVTPRAAQLLDKMLSELYPRDRVAVVAGDVQAGAAFSRLPFDHLLFTGSTRVGREVMRAAAENLTPVTLELGGKTPTVISRDVSLAMAAERICFGKSVNAGQSCVAPDYVLCPREHQEAFLQALEAAFARMYPVVADNADYSCIVNERHRERLSGLLREARAERATVRVLGAERHGTDRKMPLTVVLDPGADSRLLREEVFGPVLPLVPYDDFDQVIEFITARPRPLALNYFGHDRVEQRRILEETHAGGVCINDTLFHVAVDDLPFGGVGESGMGRYHGHEGFLTFSHAKAVFSRPRFNSARAFYPPYGSRLQRWILRLFVG